MLVVLGSSPRYPALLYIVRSGFLVGYTAVAEPSVWRAMAVAIPPADREPPLTRHTQVPQSAEVGMALANARYIPVNRRRRRMSTI
jgi:hypothetical protein